MKCDGTDPWAAMSELSASRDERQSSGAGADRRGFGTLALASQASVAATPRHTPASDETQAPTVNPPALSEIAHSGTRVGRRSSRGQSRRLDEPTTAARQPPSRRRRAAIQRPRWSVRSGPLDNPTTNARGRTSTRHLREAAVRRAEPASVGRNEIKASDPRRDRLQASETRPVAGAARSRAATAALPHSVRPWSMRR